MNIFDVVDLIYLELYVTERCFQTLNNLRFVKTAVNLFARKVTAAFSRRPGPHEVSYEDVRKRLKVTAAFSRRPGTHEVSYEDE